MINECLICNSEVEYLSKDEVMTCFICKKEELSKIRCVNGHYVCDECHSSGVNTIYSILSVDKSKNPIEILDRLMGESFCHMHGPEHHILVGASLLTAYKNAGGDIDFEEALKELINRGKKVPGGFCGYYGACGAAISTGIFISLITDSTPLAVESFSHANMMTSKALKQVALNGGPRCCKRDSYLSIIEAVKFVDDKFNIQMEKKDVKCEYFSLNKQCLKDKCPFYG